MDFYVLCRSSGEPGKVKSANTLTNFTNLINPGIVIGNDWEVALTSFFCHNQFKHDDGEFIEISCDLIQPLSRQNRTLACVARPFEIDSTLVNPVYYEPKIREYFPVAVNYISSINIQLWTIKTGSTLSYEKDLQAGQATVVGLHFRPKTMFSNDFVIRVESDARKNAMFPQNTCQKFTAELGQEFIFNAYNNNIEIALASITYKPKFRMLGEEHLTVFQYNPDNPNAVIYEGKIEPFNGETADQYMTYISNVLNIFKTTSQPVNILCSFKQDLATGIRRLYLVANKKCVIQLPYSIMFNLGERNFIPIEGLSQSDAVEKYSYKLILDENTTYNFACPVDPDAFYPDVACLHCDFIQPTLVGNSSQPIIKTFPLEKREKNKNYVTYSTTHPEFYPVSKYDLSFVNFELKDITGKFIPFHDRNSNIIITLLVRNRNKFNQYY